MQELVTQGVLNQGQANGLIAKLNAAIGLLDQGQVVSAVALLEAFVHEVQGFYHRRNTHARGGSVPHRRGAVRECVID